VLSAVNDGQALLGRPLQTGLAKDSDLDYSHVLWAAMV